MKYSDLRDQIQTGDLMLIEGERFASRVIEVFTRGRFSHVGVFWRDTAGGVWIAEEIESIGYHCVPASSALSEQSGDVYLGVAPAPVRQQPDKVMEVVQKFRSDKNLQPYGWITLPRVLAAHFGAHIDPEKVQAVCSIFAQRCYMACGIKFETLCDPSDFDGLVAGTELIEI